MRSSDSLLATSLLALVLPLSLASPAFSEDSGAPAGWWRPAGPSVELAGRELDATLVGSLPDGEVFLATAAGLWRGSGDRWRPQASSPSFLPGAIVASPIVAGLGKPVAVIAYSNLFVFLSPRFTFPDVVTGFFERSQNGGRTFEECVPNPPVEVGSGAIPGENRAIAAIAYDPADPGRVYLATGDGLLRVDVTRCDGLEPLATLPLTDVIALAGSSGTVLSGTVPSGTVLVAASRENGSRLLRSTDGGESWIAGLPGSEREGGSWALAAAGTSGASFALAGGSGPVVLWESRRNGQSWRPRAELPVRGTPRNLAVDAGGRLFAVVDASEGAALLRSLDAGRNWLEVTPNPGPGPARLETHARGISWSKAGELFESSDAGSTWQETPLPIAPEADQVLATGAQLVALELDPPFPATAKIPLTSPDGGASWQEADLDLPEGIGASELLTLRRSPHTGVVYATTSSREIPALSSQDGGLTWTRADDGLPDFGRLAVVEGGPPRAIDELFFVRACSGACSPGAFGTVLRSEDGGRRWSVVSEPPLQLVGDVDAADLGASTAIAVVGSGFLTLPTRFDALQVSFDGGTTFSGLLPVPRGSGALLWVRILAPGSDGGSTVPRLLLGTAGGVFSSDDLGDNWLRANLHPAAYSSRRPIADPDDPARLYLATDRAGVFESLDTGETWRPLVGLAGGLEVRGLDFDPADRVLWAATAAGIFARSRPRTGECVASDTAHCLAGGRFRAEARFRTEPFAQDQSARTFEITSDTGAFWFFEPANLELVVKVLDACAINDSWWVFTTGLTDVEVELVVTDSATGVERRIATAAGEPFRPVFDVSAFPCP